MARLLIWNRGEIAVRIAHAAARLGVPCVAAVTPADRGSGIVDTTATLDLLPTSAPSETYLSLDAIRAAIARTAATHVHPGYGFLSESPLLARAVAEAGATFVGPEATVLAEMASKHASKQLARDAGLPELGVTMHETENGPSVPEHAYPILLKADAGGGGRGIERVDHHDALAPAVHALRARAKTLFGDDTLLAERFVASARHVELQVFGVKGRGTRVLDSRDCSVQRNHQKVVEEGPAQDRAAAAIARHLPGIEQALTARGYRGAGTVELLYAPDTDEVFFLEMNPRIQVEHPVTEVRLGIDLVAWQLREALELDADRIWDALPTPRHHVIEVRIYAEDPESGFVPDAGVIHLLEPPVFPWARWDSSQRRGTRVAAEFDPLIAKLIVHGHDRAEAIARLALALDHTHVHGVRTNLALLRAIVSAEAFVRDAHDVRWLTREMPRSSPGTETIDVTAIARWLDRPVARAAPDRSAWKEAFRR